MILASGAIPIVVILPDRDSLHAARRGAPRIFDPLVAELRTKGVTVFDPTDGLVSGDPRIEVARLFMPGGHYSPLGNRRIAALLGSYIEQNVEPTVRARRPATAAVME